FEMGNRPIAIDRVAMKTTPQMIAYPAHREMVQRLHQHISSELISIIRRRCRQAYKQEQIRCLWELGLIGIAVVISKSAVDRIEITAQSLKCSLDERVADPHG